MGNQLYLPQSVHTLLANIYHNKHTQLQKFDCGTCTKCCETAGLEIIVTLPDIFRVSRHYGKHMEEIFDMYFTITATNFEQFDRFRPFPDDCAPLSLQIEPPCVFLDKDYKKGRKKNCTINDVKFSGCRFIPLIYFDPSMTSPHSEPVVVPLDSASNYDCIYNRYIRIEQLRRAKAFTFLHYREFEYTMKTLYQPRIFVKRDVVDQTLQDIKTKISVEDSTIKDAVRRIQQDIRFRYGPLNAKEVAIRSIVRREIHSQFKEQVIERLEDIENNPDLMERLEQFATEYFDISNGKIPEDSKLNQSRLNVRPP